MNYLVRGILLDIEGTTSSVQFVFDVMFPFVRRELNSWLAKHWQEADCQAAVAQIAQDAGYSSAANWLPDDSALAQQTVASEIIRLMDADIKATGLKMLQGMIWKDGFASGELVAEVFDDVPPALQAWQSDGFDVRIYSSGSVNAQKLFFGHTTVGNLLPFFQGHYDTTIGSKKEAPSYQAITQHYELKPSEILFCSDIPAELDAARTAGMQTALLVRPGNAPVPETCDHPAVTSFAQLNCTLSK